MTRSALRRSHLAVPVLVACALAVSACGGGADPLATSSPSGAGASDAAAGGTAGGGAISVGAANFSESQLLAALYAGALTAKGVNATATDPIGTRETYLKALSDGSIQVMPEYTGALALYYDKSFAETDPEQVYTTLKAALPQDLTVLEKSAAEDNDSITVTKETADQRKLTTLSDLSAVAKDLTLGAPAEFKTRTQGIPGLTKTYNVTFGKVRELQGQGLVQALKNGQIDAANIFTTDPSIAANDFVVLQDDKKLFGAQNVVPLVAKSAVTPQLTEALNAVSSKLTTQALQSLLAKVDIEHQDVSTVAKQWLSENGLG